MEAASRSLVLIGGEIAGTIERHSDEDRLSYASAYVASSTTTPLSVACPVRRRSAHSSFGVRNWLEGLLPDSDEVKNAWRREYGIQRRDAMAYLGTPIGHDCAGAVQFCREDGVESLLSRGGGVQPLSESDVEDLVRGLLLPTSNWHSGEQGRFSLGGAQSKTAVAIDENGVWGIPWGTAPTTHIVKPTIPGRSPDEYALNEYLCMEAASHLGLRAASTQPVEIGGVVCLIVRRYDRPRRADGTRTRLHQEDMCQALGTHPDGKYQNEGGPTPRDIMNIIEQHSSQPSEDATAFLDALIYNWIIAGTDAHAKNYSLLLDGSTVRLAPLYDLSSWLPYEADPQAMGRVKLAMKVGRGYTLRQSDRKSAWFNTGTSLGFDGDYAVARAEGMAARAADAFNAAATSLLAHFQASEVVGRLVERVQARSRRCAMALSATGPPAF